MPDVTIKRLGEFETAYGGGLHKVRAGLGVSSFGLAVLELPPNFHHYPEHDHRGDQQEEVFSVIEGAATLHAGGEQYELVPGVWARVGPGETRKITTADAPARIVALGATPGRVYEPPTLSEAGQLPTVGPA
jgi:mannose-6-phosphate isomerase-like protein (cupin superfamily)